MDEVVAAPSGDGVLLTAGSTEHRSAVIAGSFPDHRALLEGLGPVRTRAIVARDLMLQILEETDSTIQFALQPAEVSVATGGKVRCLPAKITGSAVTLSFDPATLLPAVHAALGPDLMLDIIAADQPVILRSATDGDLTTLAMPVRALHPDAAA